MMAKNITTLVFTILMAITCTVYVALVSEKETSKPISYPEEIQAVRAGDTLIVYSVSDSIYIGFKPLKK